MSGAVAKNATKPDPSKWSLLYFPESYPSDSIVITDDEDDLLEIFYRDRATVGRSESEAAAVAEFIMRACRSHAALCAALRQMLPFFYEIIGDDAELSEAALAARQPLKTAGMIRVAQKARAVLEEAGG